MKIKEIITEGFSKVLYHCTTFRGANTILSTDTLGKPNIPVSFARSAYGAYHRDNKIIGVIFEVNGQKLAHNYKGAATGGENWTYDEDEYNPLDRETWQFKGKTEQFEDRIIGPIRNFSKYIVRAIVYVPTSYISNANQDKLGDNYDEGLSLVIKTIDLLESKGILVQYVTEESQLAKNVHSAVSKTEFIKTLARHGSNLAQHLPTNMQPKTDWIVTGSHEDQIGDDDYDYFEIKFAAPLATKKVDLIRLASAAIKQRYPRVAPGSIFVSHIDSLEDYRKSFDVNRAI